jgi:hypothetical protein
MYLDGGVGDEYALFRPSVFSTIIRPALSDRNGWWVFASTPRGKNLFYKIHKQSESDKDWFSLTLRASESGLLSLSELEELRKDMDPEEYAQEYECSFDAALKGAIYADEVNSLFHEKRTRANLYDPSLPTHFVFDLGYTDATVRIAWQEHKDGTIRVVNTTTTQGKEIGEHIQSILNFPDELGSVWLPHDARAKSLQTGLSIVEQFLDSNLRPNIVPGHKVRDRLAAVRKTFPRIYVDSSDEGNNDLIEALKGYRREWDDNTQTFREHPLHDWCSDYADAFGYMCLVASKSNHTGLAGSATQVRNVTMQSSQFNLFNLFADNDARRSAMGRRIA